MTGPVGTPGPDDIDGSDAGGDLGTSHRDTATGSGDIAVLPSGRKIGVSNRVCAGGSR